MGVIIWGGCRKRKVLPLAEAEGDGEEEESEDEEEEAEDAEAVEGGMNAIVDEAETEWMIDPLLLQA